MRVAIMQPYFLPYIGYWQLINAVDVFVVYDNIKYTKKGWINRNRMLLNGTDAMFSLPLKKDSDFLDVVDRELAADFNRSKMMAQFREAYRRSPCFGETWPALERIVLNDDKNLFRFLYHSITEVKTILGIQSELVISSTVPVDHSLRGEEKVLAICRELGANTYINAIGGQELYSKQTFLDHQIELKFLRSLPFQYAQFDNEFVPWLSILDVLMFNPVDAVKECVNCNFELL